jgi:hypothetical protein
MHAIAELLVCSLLAVGQSGPLGGDYGTPHVVVPAPEDARYSHLGWPKIVQAADGTLVVACLAGRAHTVDGSPAVSISTDRGKSFSPPAPLASFDRTTEYRHSGNLAMGRAEDGSIVVLAMAFSGDAKNTIFGWRSEDSARTWQPVDTSALAENKTGSVYGHVFPAGERGLAVCGHYRKPSQPFDQGIWIAFSADHGKTWGPPQRIAAEKLAEPAVICTAGRFLGLFRDAEKSWRYWHAVSDDGNTWQVEPGPIANPETKHSQPSPFIVADPTEPNRLYAMQSQRGVEGDTKGRIYLWTADARRLDWKRLGLVAALSTADKENSDWSYPWMTRLDDGDWFVVFYAGKGTGANSIYGMRMRPDQPARKLEG